MTRGVSETDKPGVRLQSRMSARAWMVGERIDIRAPRWRDALAVAPTTVRVGKHGFGILFRYGALVLVEVTGEEEIAFLDSLSVNVTGRFEKPALEEATLLIDPAREERITATGEISLQAPTVDRLQVVAHVLAKSAVLGHYEARLGRAFDQLEPLAERLRSGRHGRASGRELRRQLGEVLLAQTRTVGRAEVTEKPEITWDAPQLDRLYEHLSAEFELHERDLALSRKVELISDTTGTFLDLLQNRQSLRVEWYIVVLIVIEILLFMYELFLK